MAEAKAITQPPSGLQRATDSVFRGLCYAFAWLSVLAVIFIVLRIAFDAAPAMRQYGLGFFTTSAWDPNKNHYGILAEIWGTMYTSVLALVIGGAFGVAAAVFLSEGYLGEFVFSVLKSFHVEFHPFWRKLPEQVEDVLKNLVELLAAIPSVVYGLWGFFIIIPLIRPACNWLHMKMGWFAPFGTGFSGPGVLPAVIVLSIMILPTITAISRDALVSVPPKLRMAAYGLGATPWETILAVILPTAARGIVGGILLGFGRALGETMALAMLCGNANTLRLSLFSPANTLAALLANTFPEAQHTQVGALMYAALVLLGITLVVNVIGAFILQRASAGLEGAK